MAISSKDLESLWQRYKVEAVPAGISVNQFLESNGVPYHVFEKWYKKKYQAPNVVDYVVAGAPNSTSAVPTPSKQDNPSIGLSPAPTEDAVVIKYVNLGLSNGMKIDHHNLSYSNLPSFPSHSIRRFSQDGSSQQKEERSSSLRGIREDGAGNSRRTIDGPDEVYDGGINLFSVDRKP